MERFQQLEIVVMALAFFILDTPDIQIIVSVEPLLCKFI